MIKKFGVFDAFRKPPPPVVTLPSAFPAKKNAFAPPPRRVASTTTAPIPPRRGRREEEEEAEVEVEAEEEEEEDQGEWAEALYEYSSQVTFSLKFIFKIYPHLPLWLIRTQETWNYERTRGFSSLQGLPLIGACIHFFFGCISTHPLQVDRRGRWKKRIIPCFLCQNPLKHNLLLFGNLWFARSGGYINYV